MPVWAPGQTLASLGPGEREVLALPRRGRRSWPTRTSTPSTPIPTSSKVPLDRLLSKAHAQSLCARVNPTRASSRPPGANADTGGDTIVLSTADRDGNMVAWVNSIYSDLRLRRHRAGLRDLAAQPRRPVHPRPEEPQRDRAAEAPVQHALRRLRDAQRPAADDGHADGRRHAGPGHRAGAGQRARPRREPAGGERHGPLPPHPGAATC